MNRSEPTSAGRQLIQRSLAASFLAAVFITLAASSALFAGGAPTVTAVSAENGFSLFIKSDGSLWAMGNNSYGQLGDGTTTDRYSPVEIVSSGVTAIVAGGFPDAYFTLPLGVYTPTISVSAFSLFLKSNGSLWAMGDNSYGQLGDGTTTQRDSPEEIVSSGVTAIGAGGGYESQEFSIFLKSNGSFWAMGGNAFGQFGDDNYSQIPQTTPMQTISSNVTAVAAGASLSLFLESDGSLWGMGGEIGVGGLSNADYISPQEIESSGVTAISAGWFFNLYIKSGGSLWGFGDNEYGQLGNDTSDQFTSPVEIEASGVTAIAAGNDFSLFVKSDGSLWAMGSNEYGQLGDGTTTPRTSPEEIVSSGVIAVAAGNGYSLFIKSDGSLWAMGNNDNGQLGDGTTTNQIMPELEYPAPISAQMLTPGNGSVFTSTSGTFTWSPGLGVSELWLTAGSSSGGTDLYSAQVTGTSQTLTLPADGRTLYVNLWSQTHGAWQSSSDIYMAMNGSEQILTPANGSAFASTTGTLTWTSGTGVSELWLTVGSSSGGTDLYSAQVFGTGEAVTLPSDGRVVYATLWSEIDGHWLSSNGVYTAMDEKAQIISPSGGNSLSSGTVTFNWSTGSGIGELWLTAGSTPGATDIYSAQVTGTSQTVTALPTDGRRIYVVLYSDMGGKWPYNAYTYNAASSSTMRPMILTPANGSTFASSLGTFTWSPGTGVSEYWLTVGSAVGGADLYSAQVSGTSQIVTLPTDGRPLYAALWSLVGGVWTESQKVYTAETSGNAPYGLITSPANGSMLSSSTQALGALALNWNAGTGVGEYWLVAGSSPGAGDIYSAQVTGTGITLPVPLHGERIYVELWSEVNGSWASESYYYDTTQ